jgi:hypothetical protein
LEKHIFEGEINSSWEAGWAHSKIAIDSWKTRYEWEKTDLWNWFYNSYVRVFDKNLYDKHKSEYDIWLANPKNKWKTYTYMNINDFWWKKKDKPSTFFPDSWSKEKIKDEIAEAYTNMKWWYLWNRLVYRWYTSWWQPLEFTFNDDWSISSVYWNFKQDFNSVIFNLPWR